MIVGKAKNLDVLYSDGVFYTATKFPWHYSTSVRSPFTHKVDISPGMRVYIDPKNKGLIPYEHEWTYVNPAATQILMDSRAKKSFRDIHLKNAKPMIGGGITKDININIPTKEMQDLLNGKKEGEAEPTTPGKKMAIPVWVWLLLGIGGIWFFFLRKKRKR